MKELKEEIINYLKSEAKKKIKGSGLSPEEHFFGIAAEIIGESIQISKIEELRNKLLNKTLGGVTTEVLAGRKMEIEDILKDLQSLIYEAKK